MLKLAARNVFRNKVKTTLTLAAIAFGVVGLILSGGFVQDIFVQLGEAMIHSQTGHIQIAKVGAFSVGSRFPERYRIEDPAQAAAWLAASPEVVDVLARASFSGLLNNGRTDLAIVGEGVEPDKENRLGTLLRVTAGRRLADTDTFGIMLGQGVAKSLNLRPGDRATVLTNTAEGALNTLDVEVIGVFQTFSRDFDARAVRITATAAQELLGSVGANTLVVSLRDTAQTQLVADRLKPTLVQAGMELKTWPELNDFYDKTVELYNQQFGFLRIIILVMVVLSVANSVNTSVLERLAEFGTMKALGNRNHVVFGLIMTECMIVGAIGAALGASLGIGLASLISAVGIPMPPTPNSDLGYVAHVRIIPSLVAIACGIGWGATVIAALLPARRVAAHDISDALRHRF